MAGGGYVQSSGGGGATKQYSGRMTCYVFWTCVVAAFGGFIFGYDIGISGGVTSMPTFLKKFFHPVYLKEEGIVSTNQYCTFDSQLLTLFTSSLYLAALVGSVLASLVTKKFGRKTCILGGAVIFLFGAALNGSALNIWMLIVGRICLGLGIGFENQTVPLFLSEMAPHQYRGALNVCFQLMITLGILVANLVNFGTNKISGDLGWRLSLGLAAVPAVVIIVGSIFLPDTPASMIERGKIEKAKETLKRIRGTNDVNDEYNDMVHASNESKAVKNDNSWKTIVRRMYRPHLVMALLIPVFQQLTGINVIMFYAPVLFKTLGLGNDASLVNAVITGLVNVFATFIAVYAVDKRGRRSLFMWGGSLMFICQILIGSLIWYKFGTSGVATIPSWYAYMLLLLICIYVAAFAFSWGPLGWLVPSEIFPLEIRSTGQNINVGLNMFMTFVIGQLFLKALCGAKFGLFYVFAVFVLAMSLFVYFLLPETKDIPIEEMSQVWRQHRFWKRYVPAADDDDGRKRAIQIV